MTKQKVYRNILKKTEVLVSKVWGDEFVNDYKRKVGEFIKSTTNWNRVTRMVNKKSRRIDKRKTLNDSILFDLTSFASGEYNLKHIN